MNLEYRFHTLQEQRRVCESENQNVREDFRFASLGTDRTRERERERVLKENGKRAREKRERKSSRSVQSVPNVSLSS